MSDSSDIAYMTTGSANEEMLMLLTRAYQAATYYFAVSLGHVDRKIQPAPYRVYKGADRGGLAGF